MAKEKSHLEYASLRSTDRQRVRSKWGVYLLTALLVCSVILNVLLAREIEHLRYIEASLKAEAMLQSDTNVPVIEARSLDGKMVSFSYGDSELPSVIYVLSPTCSWCLKNQSNVEAVAKSVDGRYRFIAVSLEPDGLEKYVKDRQITFPVYSHLSAEVIAAYKMGGTPQTIVVSPQGKVLKNWTGAYGGTVQREVEDYLGVRLPGLDRIGE